MTTDLQTRIAAIKAECEEILKLEPKLTPPPWGLLDGMLAPDGEFVVRARNVSPAMARVVLGTLITAEKLKDMEGGDMWLESIANQWEGK